MATKLSMRQGKAELYWVEGIVCSKYSVEHLSKLLVNHQKDCIGPMSWMLCICQLRRRRHGCRSAAQASESKAADTVMRLEAVPTRRVNTMRAPASSVTTDAAGMAVVCQPLRVPKASRS